MTQETMVQVVGEESSAVGMTISVNKEWLDTFRAEAKRNRIERFTDFILDVDGIQRAFTYEELLELVKADKPKGLPPVMRSGEVG